MRFTNPRKLPFARIRSRGELPHLFKDGGTYFVTFRLYDAVESGKPGALPTRPPSWKEIVALAEPPLKLGSCALGRSKVAQIVQDALLHFQKSRYFLSAWCVMPNHVHTVITPTAGQSLSEITHSWKSFTANQINKLLGKSGTFWERESFDHLIRSEYEMRRLVDYIEHNPVAAGLCQAPEEWGFSSAFPGNRHKLLV